MADFRVLPDGTERILPSGEERALPGVGHSGEGEMDVALDVSTEPMLCQSLDGVQINSPVRISVGGTPEVRLYLMDALVVPDPLPLSGDWQLMAWDPARGDADVVLRLLDWTETDDGTYPYLSARMDLSSLSGLIDDCEESITLRAQIAFRDALDVDDVRFSEIFEIQLLQVERALDWVTPVNEYA